MLGVRASRARGPSSPTARSVRSIRIPLVSVRLLAWLVSLLGRSAPSDGRFPFVYVEADGTARELDANERAYLTEEFHPADGGRPAIKGWYRERTPDGRISGYLRRTRLPAHVVVRPARDA